MPRVTPKPESDNSVFAFLVEQSWLAFLFLGVFIVGLRLYNVKQRSDQRRLLRESLMAEVSYKGKAAKKAN